jgi:hypothetical protein
MSEKLENWWGTFMKSIPPPPFNENQLTAGQGEINHRLLLHFKIFSSLNSYCSLQPQ